LPVLNIPEEHLPGLALLRKMPDEAFAAAIVELEHSPDSTPSIPNVSPEDAEVFKAALDTMYAVRAYSDVGTDEFVDDVCDALRSVDELPSGEEPKFRERLNRILNVDALSVAAKAVLLQNEHEHDFCTARVLTDVRPIFGEDVVGSPSAVIITHTLKLSYHQGAGGRLQEIYMSMGSRDIKELRQVLDRAEKKASSLRAVLETSQLRLIDPQH
jgi:hypothetical protein